MKLFFHKRVDTRHLFPVFCPHCFRTFPANNVVFRKPDTKEITPEDPYIEYYNQYYYRNLKVYLPRTIDPAYIPSEKDKKYDSNGMLIGVYDVEGDNSLVTNRICPYCHNRLAAAAGTMPFHVLSVVGFKFFGKTTYEAALIHSLRMDSIGCSNVSVGFKEGIDVGMVEDNIKKIREDVKVVSTSIVDGPFTYQISVGSEEKKPFLLNMVDLPGEAFQNAESLKTVGHAIPNSDTCIFLVDLEHMDQCQKTFGSLVGNYRKELLSGSINVAVVLYKTDLLSKYYPNLPENLSFDKKRNYRDNVPIDLDRIDKNHNQIITFVLNGNKGQDFKALYADLQANVPPKNLKLFAAHSNKDNRFDPCNVEEPLLWSLALKGLYPRKEVSHGT